MPPLCLHLSIAKEVATILRNPILDGNLGCYLLGSTSPDIRIITGASREETHFFDLTHEGTESGTKQLFKIYPGLENSPKLNGSTKAFVAGYLSHLVTDEVWITEIYRPFFGVGSTLDSSSEANVLDRALQFELDRRERLDRDKMAAIKALLCKMELPVTIDLIEPLVLEQWRTFVCMAVNREPSWERFRLFAQRFLLPQQKVELEQLEAFLASMPAMLEYTIERVTEERIEEFRERSVLESVRVAREYLN